MIDLAAALLLGFSTGAATIPPPTGRSLPRLRAFASSLAETDTGFLVFNNETVVRALTDDSVSGAAAPPWVAHLRNALQRSLTRTPVEAGYDHPEESTIAESLEDHGDDAAALFAGLILSDEPWRADLLRLISRLPSERVHPWGMDVVEAALNDPQPDVREAAISALETWGGEDARRLLASHDDPEPWLVEFAHRVAAEIARELA